MGNKVKPWHSRKPKKHGEHGGKRVVPLRPSQDKRIAPLRTNDRYEDERVREWNADDYDDYLDH